MSDEELNTHKITLANLEKSAEAAWDAKEKATSDWYIIAKQAGDLRAIIEREEMRRRWVAEFEQDRKQAVS
jgi:hypothetical protein